MHMPTTAPDGFPALARLACTAALLTAFGLATCTAGPARAAGTDADLADCTSCHTAEAASFDEDSDGLAAEHASLAKDCTDCHDTANRGFVIVHKKTDGKALPTELKRTKASAQACPTCHDADDLVEATSGADVALVDEKGTAVNPHDLPANESHDALTCFDCHVFHGTPSDGDTESVAEASAAKTAAEAKPSAEASQTAQKDDASGTNAAGKSSATTAAQDQEDPLAGTLANARSLCISCHHAGVFECGTCH